MMFMYSKMQSNHLMPNFDNDMDLRLSLHEYMVLMMKKLESKQMLKIYQEIKDAQDG